MDVTAIHWADSTVNPTMGCDGCELWERDPKGIHNCYTGKQHTIYGGSHLGYAADFLEPTLHPGRVAKAAELEDLRGKRRPGRPWLDALLRIIFLSDMGDALSKAVPFAYLYCEVILNVISAAGLRHIWIWLTKRPERMAEFCAWLAERGIPWPSNLWPGTSITQQRFVDSRIEPLLRVGDDRTTRVLSCEPQLEPLDLTRRLAQFDMLIQGGESGSQARPFSLAWARQLKSDCENVKGGRVAYFLKQLGSNVPEMKLESWEGGDWAEWPEDLRVRQFPIWKIGRQ
jgi:protein gp37